MKNRFKIKARHRSLVGLFAVVLLILGSCKKGEPIINLPLSGPDQVFYVLSANSLLRFNSNNIKTQAAQVSLTGLANTTEKLLSIDFRPATGELYAVSDASKIYVIEVSSGRARLVSDVAFSPGLAGTVVSLDFNPTVDRIRIITDAGQNLRLNPETGQVVATDTNIANTNITGIAYSNNTAIAENTTLYDIDFASKVLYKQDPPNNGALVKVGDLGVDMGTNVSFDISPDNKNALAVGRTGTGANLFTVSLTSGLAELVGRFPASLVIQGLAIPVNPAAYAVSDNNLVIIDFANAKTLAKPLTGLQTGENILGMDMRPVNGQLYALGSSSRLYTLNIGTGACTLVGALSMPLIGTSFGFDFNPVVDLIRIVSNTGQNFRVNPSTAVVTVDANITTTASSISAAAYSNNFKGATVSLLYVINATDDKLYTQEPNSGVLTAVGELKVNTENMNGFDIVSTATGNTAYGIFTVAGKNGLYKVELSSGLATLMGEINFGVSAFTLGLKF